MGKTLGDGLSSACIKSDSGLFVWLAPRAPPRWALLIDDAWDSLVRTRSTFIPQHDSVLRAD